VRSLVSFNPKECITDFLLFHAHLTGSVADAAVDVTDTVTFILDEPAALTIAE